MTRENHDKSHLKQLIDESTLFVDDKDDDLIDD